MFNVAFITLSIVSLVLSAKFRRNLTEGKAKTLKTLRGFLLAGIIFSAVSIVAVAFTVDMASHNNSNSEAYIYAFIFNLYEAVFACAALPLTIVSFVKTNSALTYGAPAPAVPLRCYCTKCGAERAADGSFCANCGSREYFTKAATPLRQFCSACHAERTANSNFCTHCGSREYYTK